MQSYLLASAPKNATVLNVVTVKAFPAWKKAQGKTAPAWLDAQGFEAKAGKVALLPDTKGGLVSVLAVISDTPDMWSLAHLAGSLPKGVYKPELYGFAPKAADWEGFALGWQLATYQFTQLKSKPKPRTDYAQLVLPKGAKLENILPVAEATFMVRDLVNRPANDLTPLKLADAAKAVAKKHKATATVISGEELLKANYPLVHAVGRASENVPCLVDLRWGNAKHPKVTLVGKGICFDSGGLDIKPSSGMKLMKKDMGGAAQVLGLAHLIMAAKLKVRLRVLIPAAENSVSGNAFRPMDIIKSRKGLTVEIGNTDAEGRLVLCDALTEADGEKPALLIDCATLTGAARVALGTELPAFFTPDDALARDLEAACADAHDPLWRLPLWAGYRDALNSELADINSAPDGGYGGAITAALYLKEFVENTKAWVHVDLMAWNLRSRAGRPAGGEAMGMRALFKLVEGVANKA